MAEPVSYDLTRLLCGLNTFTPNGIDRVDLCFARHYLKSPQYDPTAIVLSKLKPWRIDADAAVAALAQVEAHWRESAGAGDDRAFQLLRQAIIDRAPGRADRPQRIISERKGRSASMAALMGAFLPQLRNVLSAPPGQGVFFHTTQFPFASMFRWLESRPNVKAVFFIHDLLPMKCPEYFTAQNQAWHRRSLEVLARYGAGAIVNGAEVQSDLRQFLDRNGRPDLPILVAPIPADATFSEPVPFDPDLAASPYFVMCGTIEPRKNHLLMLHLWRDLAQKAGSPIPKLLIVGKRGWKNENVVDMLERSTAIMPHVIEASGLSTPAMKHFIAHARALLMPSFAEGYCLPMVEALALGTPVVASDIPVFREVGKDRCAYRSPIDGPGWRDAIQDLMEAPATARRAQGDVVETTLPEYFVRVDEFISTLRK